MIREAGQWATEAFWMLVERFDAFLFDLDGVAYLGDELLPGSREALVRIRETGTEVRFLTDDPRPTREQLRRQAPRHMFAGARFVATNADASFPSPKGPLPGTGAIVEALRVTTSVEPMIVGKPSAAMFDIALRDLHAGRDRTALVGDSLESDIPGAHRAGIAGVLIAREDSQPAFTQAPPALEAIIRDLGGLFDPPAPSVRGSRSAARNAIGGKH